MTVPPSASEQAEEPGAGSGASDTGPPPASVPPAQRLLSSTGPVFFATVLLLAVVMGSTAMLLSSLRRDSFKDRQRELDNLALTLSEQTARAFQALGLVQASIVDQVEDARVTNRETLVAAMSGRDVYAQMREKISGLPYVDAVTLIDDTGRLINFSRFWPIPKVNVADRDYFKALAAADKPGVFVSEPVVNRGTGTMTIYFAQRFDRPGGGFLGLVLGAMEQSYFERFYGAIQLGSTGLIALVRRDGAMLARWPSRNAESRGDPSRRARRANALFSLKADGDGNVAAGILDDAARVVAVRQLAGYPLAVVVSDSMDALNQRHWQKALPIVVASGLLCVAIVLLGYFVARQMRSERAFARQQHHMARHDPLTGLPNRLAFAERLEVLLGPDGGPPFVLCFLDLDYFKSVNDTLGHDVGDALLKQVGERLREQLATPEPSSARTAAAMDPQCMVVRLGGDEFAVLRTQVSDHVEALELARAIIELVREPFDVGLHHIVAGYSLGLALSPRDGTSVATLLKKADLALYRAKSDGRGVARMFLPELERAAFERRALEMDLNEAWTARALTLAYQPIFEAQTGQLAGFEALARWRHPDRGEVPASAFISVAEETGLILPMGAWVLEEACRVAAGWPSRLFISVNLSPIQFRGAHAFRQVRAALDHSGLPPKRLELEITESTLLQEGPAVRATLDRFCALGITLALDDFGTGYSSLRYLRTLKIGRIKVDRAFLEKIDTDAHNLTILRAILSLAGALSLKSTAEGIESEEQLRLVKAEGCTHLQGFLLGRPCSGEEASRLAQMVTQ